MSVTTQLLTQWKQQERRIVALTAWDYAIARLLDISGVDLILVGDSLAVILGYETTLPITLDEMIHHAKSVCRGVKSALVVVDLPFLTYQESISQAMQSAGRVLKETGAQAVKLEGGYPAMVAIIT
ncbi:MAG: 3-methyl-2-oxobutanoate hydroxymethyltransferase, partial [Dolichospermum sp.]